MKRKSENLVANNRKDYTMRNGKEAEIARNRHRMGEAQHNNANAFVKREQEAVKSMGGKAPELREESLRFSSYMCNNGEHAQEMARDLTRDIDHKAFPVR